MGGGILNREIMTDEGDDMAKKSKSTKVNGGEVKADVAETAAIEKSWTLTGRSKPRKPSKKYKYVDELAHLRGHRRWHDYPAKPPACH